MAQRIDLTKSKPYTGATSKIEFVKKPVVSPLVEQYGTYELKGGTRTTSLHTPGSVLAVGSIPNFPNIRFQDLEAGIKEAMAHAEKGLLLFEQELAKNSNPSWDDVFVAQRDFKDPLTRAWGLMKHLNNVKQTKELRALVEVWKPRVIEFDLKKEQSQVAYEAMLAVKERSYASLTPARQRALDQAIQAASFAGIGIQDSELRAEFNTIKTELASHSLQFENQWKDSLNYMKGESLIIDDPKGVDGVPESFLRQCAIKALKKSGVELPKDKEERERLIDEKAKSGPWLFSLDNGSYLRFMRNCTNRDMREALCRMRLRAATSEQSGGDNRPVILAIAKLRQRMAEILGFKNYAELSTAKKMVGTPEPVVELLDELGEKAMPKAKQEHAELQEFARKELGEPTFELKTWDVSYWVQQHRKKVFGLDQEKLKEYFPMESVLQGMFKVAERLFGIQILPAKADGPKGWDKDVRYFNIYRDGQKLSSFFLDPLARPQEKRGGAWMDFCLTRNDSKGIPSAAYMHANAEPGEGDRPPLTKFRDIVTLFHEFGHGLHHMLTEIGEPEVSGIHGVEWDAVERPSQFMEYWAYNEHAFLNECARHYRTNEPLPDELVEKVKALPTYRAANQLSRQVRLSYFDLAIHGLREGGIPKTVEDLAAIEIEIADRFGVMDPLNDDWYMCTFPHPFTGEEYAAGYYSYRWAKVMSAEDWDAFDEAGVNDPERVFSVMAEVGQKYSDTTLALGGSVHPRIVFEKFRGRPATVEPMLRHAGII